MFCPKQGLSRFVSNRYIQKTGVVNDYSSEPRPCHNLARIMTGSVELIQDRRHMVAHAGELIFIPQGSCYISKWLGDGSVRFQTLHFAFQWQNDPLKNLQIPVQVFTPADGKKIEEIFDELHREQNNNSFAFNRIFYGMCEEVLENLSYSVQPKPLMTEPAVSFLEEHFMQNPTVAFLAGLCHMSQSYFFACFKKETGTTPVVYKNRLCIRHAMYDLIAEPTKSIEEIARRNGFESIIYFRRVFKSVTNQTPGAFRSSGIMI